MYLNLDAEMARKNITQKKMAEMLGITPTTFSLKTNGNGDFALRECKRIKELLGTNLPLEKLFEKSEKVAG